jgi:L,D-transpeptidase YcbB
MLRWCVLALGLASSTGFVAVADAKKPAPPPRVAAAETLPAAAPPVAPAPAPQDALGIALQQKLTAATKLRRDDGDAQDRAALAAFYATRIYAPLWISNGALNAKAAAIVAEVGKADDWGLEAKDFAVPTVAAAPSVDALADAEVTLSLTALKYARYARGGRITDPATQLSSYLDRKPQLIDAKDVVEKLAAAGEPDAYLRGLHPKHPQFEKLRQKYLELRAGAAAPAVVRLPDGGHITPGKRDAQVALLRKRLQVPLPAATDKPADETFYDDGLKAAVMAFQKEHGMRPDGIVGNATRAALNDVDVLSPQKILANMEELRWMPDDLGELYVTVNIPGFTLRIVKNGAVIHTERVITGLPDKQTPVFSETMKTIIFKPRWNVPESIKVVELWPGLARGGTYFSRQGLRLSQNGREVDPSSVDWSSTDIRKYDIYQPPGGSNVLGELKFAFPNKHTVYMHDTPTKALFDEASRPFSHGCMRVRNPRRMAEILLYEDKGWDAAKIAELLAAGPDNNEVPIEKKIGVHITYLTAWVDEKGELQTARDVYGHEKRITQALAGQWSQIAIGPNHLAPPQTPESVSYASGNPIKSINDFFTTALGGGF